MRFIPTVCTKILPDSFKFLNESINHTPHQCVLQAESELRTQDFSPDIDSLSIGEQRYLYSVLSIILHKYIYLSNVPNELPPLIKKLWFDISNKLGIYPVITHASVDLWNWSLIDESKPFSLDNIKSNHLFLDKKIYGDSEEWFYLVVLAIEYEGSALIELFQELDQPGGPSPRQTTDILHQIAGIIENMTKILKRMHEKCDPNIFYNHLRIYLSGSNGYVGASAAQSTIIQVIDAFFGVKHEGHGKIFLDKMKNYMPREHREYLEEQQNKVHWKTTDNNEKALYNTCLLKIQRFRQEHLNLIHAYIVNPSKVPALAPAHAQVHAHEDDSAPAELVIGTGGTNALLFCKEIMQSIKKLIYI